MDRGYGDIRMYTKPNFHETPERDTQESGSFHRATTPPPTRFPSGLYIHRPSIELGRRPGPDLAASRMVSEPTTMADGSTAEYTYSTAQPAAPP
jgi:hypothetical protein